MPNTDRPQPIRIWARDLRSGDVVDEYEDCGPVTTVTRLRWFVRADTANGHELEFGRLSRPYVHRERIGD